MRPILLPSLCATLLLASCTPHQNAPGTQLQRAGDEIVVCGQLFHTGGAPVVLWTDPGGYDAYRTDRRFAPYDKASFEATTQEAADAKENKKATALTITSPNRYGLRYTVAATQPTTQPTTRELLNGLSFELTEAQLDSARAGWRLR